MAPLLGAQANTGGGLGFSKAKKRGTDVKENERLTKFAQKLTKPEEEEQEEEEEASIPFYLRRRGVESRG